MWKSVWAGVAAAVLVAVVAGNTAARAEVLRIHTRDGPRDAIVLPSGQAPAPTVLVLHGAINSAAWTVRRFGFAEAAAARGFTAVFPEGINWKWNDGREDQSWKADDVAFLRQLVEELSARRISDPERVYIAGISNGGMMTLRMLCEASELFAGAGTVIANMPVATGAACRPKRAVPIVMFNGTADPLIPYDGGGVGPLSLGGFVWGTERTAAFMARANGCNPGPRWSDASAGAISLTRIAWTGCKADTRVTLYRVNGGRHQVLGRRTLLPAILGGRTHEISAAETIMAAFAGE
jgi:polyhydroxybutyrate depolymerase